MAKKKVEKPPREITKRQLTRWQEQNRKQRIALFAGITVIAAAIVVLVVGWYLNQYRPLHQIAFRINSVDYSVGYYIDSLKFYGRNQPTNIPDIADQVITEIEKNQLITNGALALGITVSEDDVNKELQTQKLGNEARDAIRASLVSSAMQSTYFDKQLPEFAEYRQIMSMLLENESQVADVKSRLAKGENFADLAAQLSLESTTKTAKGDLGWKPKGILSTAFATSLLEDKAFSAEKDVLNEVYDASQPKSVGYLILKLLDTNEQKQAHVQAMLFGTKEEAQSVKAKLDAGEDFAKLAQQYSQLYQASTNGGDVGWLTAGQWSKPVDDFIFNANTKQFAVSDIIRDETASTKGAYWLFKVTGIENRKLEGSDRDALSSKMFNSWVDGLVKDPNNKVEKLLDPATQIWVVQQASKASTRK